MYTGFVFYCENEKLQQCLRHKKYVCTDKEGVAPREVPDGSTIFLYNSNKKSLLGPFTANQGGATLEKGGWAEDIDEHSASANVKVEWEELHLLENGRNCIYSKTPWNNFHS
jgi:hypothetical protein